MDDDTHRSHCSPARRNIGIGTVPGIARPTDRARRLRREATPAERKLWPFINARQLGCRFNRQMPIGPFVADFLCRAHRLAIELDGESHMASVAHDARRDAFFADRGIRTLRFTNAEVMTNVEGVVIAIRLTLADLPTPNPSRKREGS